MGVKETGVHRSSQQLTKERTVHKFPNRRGDTVCITHPVGSLVQEQGQVPGGGVPALLM